MTKSYKIPTLLSFIDDKGKWVTRVDKKRLADTWRKYYANKAYQKDMEKHKSSSGWKSWDDEKYLKFAADNPIKFLKNTVYFHYDEINKIFYLDESLHEYLSAGLAQHFRDILNWRSKAYFAKRYKQLNKKGES
jgi:hypothetical protein